MTPAPPVEPEASILDPQAIAALWSFGPEPGRLLRQMIVDFTIEAPPDFRRLAAAAAARDAGVIALAHRLSGTCAHMGAKRLATACAVIKQATLDGSEPRISAAIVDGQMELDHAIAEVRRLHRDGFLVP